MTLTSNLPGVATDLSDDIKANISGEKKTRENDHSNKQLIKHNRQL